MAAHAGEVWKWITELAVKNDAAYLKWFVQTVFFAVFAFCTFRAPLMFVKFVKTVSEDDILYFKGYLYHAATASVKKDVLRRSILKIRPGFLNAIVVFQFNETPLRKMYWGNAEIIGETMSIPMSSKRSGGKLLNIYTLRRLDERLIFSLGMMAGANQDGDPWSLPVLLVNRPLPVKHLKPILEKIARKPITKQVRGEVETLLRALRADDDLGSINHPWGTDGAQTRAL